MVSSGLCQIVGIFLTGPIIHYFCKNHPTHGYFWTAFFSSFLDNYMSLKLFYTTLFSRKKDSYNYRFLSAFLKIQFTNTQNLLLLFCSQSVRQKTCLQVGLGFFVIHVFCNAKEGCEWVVVAFSFHMKNCCKQDSDRWV